MCDKYFYSTGKETSIVTSRVISSLKTTSYIRGAGLLTTFGVYVMTPALKSDAALIVFDVLFSSEFIVKNKAQNRTTIAGLRQVL